jgi:hypothetical protein
MTALIVVFNANGLIAVGRDPVEVGDEEVAEVLHLGQRLPAKRVDSPEHEAEDAQARRVGPEPVALLVTDRP